MQPSNYRIEHHVPQRHPELLAVASRLDYAHLADTAWRKVLSARGERGQVHIVDTRSGRTVQRALLVAFDSIA